jgi:bacteriocin-like protein
MSKSNDSSTLGRATNELRDDELQEVSGGVTLENTLITGYVVATGGGTGGGGTSSGTAGWDVRQNKVV